MTRSKKLYCLLGALAVVCAATIAVMQMEEQKEKIREIQGTILEIDGDSVTKLSWNYGTETFSFHKDGVWKYDDDESFPVNEEKIRELLNWFEAFETSFTIEEVDDYSQYGLAAPACTIDLTAGEESYEIKLGDYSKMDSKRYVSIGDGNAYLAKEDPMEAFEIDLKSLIQNDEIPAFDQVTEITFEGAENGAVFYEEDSDSSYCSEDVYFTEQSGEKKPLDTDGVENYLSNLENLSLTDYVTYDAGEKELSQYGLDSPELTITVKGETKEGDEESFVLHVSRDPAERKEAEQEREQEADDASEETETEEEEITAYARVEESKILYRITGGEYENLMAASYNDLRHREILTADFSDIEQIDISMEGENYILTSEEKGGERTYFLGEEEVDLSGFQNAVKALQADRFSEDSPEGKEEIRLTFHLDHENFPQISVIFYRYDGEDCLAVVDGETVGFVKRSYVVDLMEEVNRLIL